MDKKTIGLYLLLFAATLMTIGAFGNMFSSLPDIRDHFSYEPDTYWFNRLTASLILGSVGLLFNAGMKWLGALLQWSKDPGKQSAGAYILLASIIPNIISFVSLPLLTPSDWSHMIIHGLVIIIIPLGLFLRREHSE